MFKKLEDKLNEFLKMGIPFYDCVVMKDGECVFRKSGGYLDKENNIKPDGSEIYNIYSCSKLITCIAALQLWEKGCFDLDDELYKYMPEFENMTVKTENGIVPTKNKITIRHLFTMTAGFSYDLGSEQIMLCKKETDGRCPTRELMKYLSREPLLFEPGYRWEYSLCHDVLAALVEVISGKKFSAYVKENIFDMVGMESSTFDSEIISKTALCPQYSYNSEKKCADRVSGACSYRLGSEYESGGAGCISTVDDYIKFLEAVRTFKLVKKETIDLLTTNQLTDEQLNMPTYWVNGRRGFGLGQQCKTKDNPRPDFGWGGAAGAHYFIDCENNITAYLGTHIYGFSEYQEARAEITPIIQEILK